MARRKRSKTPLTSSHGSSITWLLRVSPMTKPSLQNLKLATSNGNYVNCNHSQNKWAIPLCAPPLNLQFLERGRIFNVRRRHGAAVGDGNDYAAPSNLCICLHVYRTADGVSPVYCR